MNNAEWRRLFLDQYENANTRASYESGLELFASFSPLPYEDVTDADLIAWKTSLAASGASGATQKLRWVAVRSLFAWLTASQRIPRNPFDAVKAPVRHNPIPKIATEAQVKSIMDVLNTTDYRDARDRAMVALMWNGLRVSEVTALDLSSLQQEHQDAPAVMNVVGKGGKSRLVPLHGQVADILHSYLYLRDITANQTKTAMFLDLWGEENNRTWGERMTRRQAASAFDRAARHAGVKGISPHALRHNFATRLIRQGVDVFSVQRLLGHSSVATTQVYINLDVTDSIKAIQADEGSIT